MFSSAAELRTSIVRPFNLNVALSFVLIKLCSDSSLGGKSYQDKDYYNEFQKKSYQIAHDIDQLSALNTKDKALG